MARIQALHAAIDQIAEDCGHLRRKTLPEFPRGPGESPGIGRRSLRWRGIVIAVKLLRISSPFCFELCQGLVIFRNFSEVIPAKPALTGAANRFDLQYVVRMKTKILRRATRESVEHSLAELQQNGSRHHPSFAVLV